MDNIYIYITYLIMHHICTVYLTYMQSTSCKMLGWMKHKLESRLPREVSITSDRQMTPSGTNESLGESERGE